MLGVGHSIMSAQHRRDRPFTPAQLFPDKAFYQGTHVGVVGDRRGFLVLSDLGGHWLSERRFDSDGINRSSCRGLRYILATNVYPVAEAVRQGFGSSLVSTGSGYSQIYCGGRAQHDAGTGNYVEWDVTGAGDLYVVYTGRTNTGIARVTIDGSSALVNAVPDQGGYRGFDTGTATDLQRRSYIKVAADLPQGTYTIRVAVSGDTNTSGTRIYIEAAAITASPGDLSRLIPPLWAPGVAVRAGQEFVGSNGYFYRVRTDGVTDATEPSHTSGIGSDGALDYNVWTFSSWQFSERFLDFSSEREYAAAGLITAQTEIGGQTHGNESLVSSAALLDDLTVDLAALSMSAPLWGASLTLSEVFTWTHADDATAGTMALSRNFLPGRMDLSAQLSIETSTMDLGWFYTAMLPAVRYSSAWDMAGFASLRTSNGDTYTLSDYSGASTDMTLPNLNGAAYFGAFDAFFAAGIWQDDPQDLVIRTNIDGVTEGDGQFWPTKTYLRRASQEQPEVVSDGQRLTWSATHFDAVAPLG